jgi:hypothetical protein
MISHALPQQHGTPPDDSAISLKLWSRVRELVELSRAGGCESTGCAGDAVSSPDVGCSRKPSGVRFATRSRAGAAGAIPPRQSRKVIIQFAVAVPIITFRVSAHFPFTLFARNTGTVVRLPRTFVVLFHLQTRKKTKMSVWNKMASNIIM